MAYCRITLCGALDGINLPKVLGTFYSTMLTLLPPWSEYSTGLALDAKEPVENFDWMQKNDGEWFMDIKDALNRVQGSRDWLRGGNIDWHSNETVARVFAIMKLRDLDNGSLVISLFRSYSECLKDWDAWVKLTKTSVARARYEKEQLPWHELFALTCLVERMEGGGLPGSNFHQIHAEFLELKKAYGIRQTNDETIAIVKAVWAEMGETAQKIESLLDV